jgi:hypothetical protein
MGESNLSRPIPERTATTTDTDMSNTAAAKRLQLYSLSYFLSDSLADVDLVLKQTPVGHEEVIRKYRAHSFILGRSTTLYDLLQNAIRKMEAAKASSKLSRSSSKASWADEMENGHQVEEEYLPAENPTPDEKLTVLLETDDKYISQDSFLLAFRSLYGASDWDLDAFLDPMHPQHRTLEWTRGSSGPPKSLDPEAGRVPQHARDYRENRQPRASSAKGEEVRMLERSIELFATGTLLGIDEVINKASWGIRRWGMQLEGGAVERLLEFIAEDSEAGDTESNPREVYRELKDQLLGEIVEFLAQCIPAGFKLDPRAPASEYLVRFPKAFTQSRKPTPGSSLSSSPAPQAQSAMGRLREAFSTILLSLPFSILKPVLEHEQLTSGNGDWKSRYDIAKAVVQERERRRKWSFRASQGLLVGKAAVASRNAEVPWAAEIEEQEGSQSEATDTEAAKEKEGVEWENLYWEESVLYAFGHGGNGENCTQLTRRKKGASGGRVLWKAGDSDKTSE